MPHTTVALKDVTREDVGRIRRWLKDEEVSESWFGRYAYGDPAHLGVPPGGAGRRFGGALEERVHRPGAPHPLDIHDG